MAARVPTYRFERDLWRGGAVRIVGVDEVGVAPTCGAVVAAAVVMRPHARRIPGVRDSKTLSAGQRDRLAPIIRRRAIAVGVGAAGRCCSEARACAVARPHGYNRPAVYSPHRGLLSSALEQEAS